MVRSTERLFKAPRRQDTKWLFVSLGVFGAVILILLYFHLSKGTGDSWRRVGGSSSKVDAIIIPGGGQTPDGPPRHVQLRLEKAVEIYNRQEPKPYIIATSRGTPHKACPQDDRGFEIHESQMNAKFLLEHGVPANHILEENNSLETTGNAYFARIVHTDVLGLKKLVVINNWWHMPRTKAVFGHVFGVEPFRWAGGYSIDWVEVESGLTPEVLKLRLEKENVALPKFEIGGPWQAQTGTLEKLHLWVHQENTAYAAKRMLEDREPIDPTLAKSY